MRFVVKFTDPIHAEFRGLQALDHIRHVFDNPDVRAEQVVSGTFDSNTYYLEITEAQARESGRFTKSEEVKAPEGLLTSEMLVWAPQERRDHWTYKGKISSLRAYAAWKAAGFPIEEGDHD